MTPCCLVLLLATTGTGENLAASAKATASESFQDLTAEQAIDGDPVSRWSGIPGHNDQVWYELEWATPVRVGEVVIRQYDRYVKELDVDLFDARTQAWHTLQHMGVADRKLPLVIAARIATTETTRLRIHHITNGPSFTEVEVHETASPPATAVAGDLQGQLIGMVSDAFGAAPIAGAQVTLTGTTPRGVWTANAMSDAQGLFRAPLPLGLTGTVAIATELDGHVTQSPIDAASLPQALTPFRLDQIVADLDGPWRFACHPVDAFFAPELDDSAWATIDVPSHWAMAGVSADVGGYRTHFSLGAGDGRLKLLFDGVYSGAEVWLNGRLVGTHEGGATPFEVDVTEAARNGDNVLAVRVREHTIASDQLDKMSQYADFPLAGIIRPVTLFRVPCAHIAAIVPTTAAARDKRATLRVHVTMANEGSTPFAQGQLTVRVRDRGQELAATAPLQIAMPPWQRGEADVTLNVPGAEPWTAESPNLYELSVELSPAASLTQQIGFREVQVRGTEITLNGAPIKLRGTCHHDSHPAMGRAVSAELERQDVELIKEANLNAVRTSHYPPRRELLDAADRRGLYVEDEGPFCWVGAADDLRLTPRILQLTAELYARDRHHPSVIIWSLCNESQFGTGFERAAEWLKAADPTRPLAAATSAWLDLATLHNPIAIARIDEHEHLDKPLLFDESFAPFQGIFGDVAELWVDPGVRDYYAEPLPAIYTRFMQSKVTQGSMIWCFADDIFCVPNRGLEYGRSFTACHFLEGCYRMAGRGLVGDAPWGLVDGWRRKKPEFWIVKKLHSPVRVREGALTTALPLRIAVANEYDFTDLGALVTTWKLGDESGTATIAVPPHSQGEIVIAPRPVTAGEKLELTFADREGHVIDAYRLPVGAAPMTHEPPTAAAMPIMQADEITLAGVGARISCDDFELVIDRATGQLRRCVAFGEPLLLELPSLHVLPTNAPLRPLPGGFALGRLDMAQDGAAIHIVIEGTYAEFVGRYDLTITRGPEITVQSEFRYQGPELRAREVGLRFSVPRECDELAWQRDAEWSFYADDHIGRPTGIARAFPQHDDRVPPAWPWSQDRSPMGSNDFRSTKRHVRSATIGAPGGARVRIDSDGGQHVRASVALDRIQVHVSDWYGGTNVGLWEWVHNYGSGKLLAPGDTIRSTLRLQLVRRTAPVAK